MSEALVSSHRVIIEEDSGQYRAICNCRGSSLFFVHRWEADDWRLQHLTLVERVRTHLSHGREPSLKAQRDYFRTQASDTTIPKDDRLLWKQLADELDHRLNDAPSAAEEGLW